MLLGGVPGAVLDDVLDGVLDVFAEVSFWWCPYNVLTVAPAGGLLDGVPPFSSVLLGF